MNNGTCIIFILFYIYRHYKRRGIDSQRLKALLDLSRCYVILRRMEKNVDPNHSAALVRKLISRVNGFGYDMKFQEPLRYSDYYDRDIITLMIQITSEIICFVKSPFYRKYSGKVFTRLLVLHNLPRTLLSDSSGDLSTPADFHISKEQALEGALDYLKDR